MNDTRDQHWNERALDELRAVVCRNTLRMGRHLEAQGLLLDPRHILCALAARRLLPLQSPVMRPLFRSDEGVEAQAYHHLQAPDRKVLWPGRAAVPLLDHEREHQASALLRLTWNAQAARRGAGAPPASGSG